MKSLLFFAIAVVAWVPAAHAQAARVDPKPRQVMVFTFSADASHDGESSLQGERQVDGLSSNARGGVAYGREERSWTLAVNATSSVRYFPKLNLLTAASNGVDAGLAANIGKHTRIQLQQSVQQSPLYMVAMLPNGSSAESLFVPAARTDHATLRWNNTSVISAAGLTQTLGSRSSLTINYGTAGTRMESSTYRSRSAGVAYNYRFTKYAAARIGYSRRLTSRTGSLVSADDHASSHDLDAGLDYSRPLSLSRRTKLSFTSGSSIVPTPQGPRLQFGGSALMTRELGRRWRASVRYARDVQFAETFVGPLLSDGVSVFLQTAVPRRLNVNISSGYSLGQVGFTGRDRGYATYQSAARVEWALTRHLAAYGDYSDFRQQIGSGIMTAPGYAHYTNRRQARVGLTTELSLHRR